MINILRKTFAKLGVDGAVAYTILSRVIQAGGGIITLFFVARFLTEVEQGYYYTFGSILAVQIFFELGLTTIITQFVAHEMALLRWDDEVTLAGDKQALSRLSSLLRFCIKWFGILSILLVLGLVTAGFIFFGNYGSNDVSVAWKLPWIILSVMTAISLMISPILAFLEGLGKVKEVAKVRVSQQFVQLSMLYILLILGLKLFSAPIAAVGSLLVVLAFLGFSSKRELFKKLWINIGQWTVNYKVEVFPYQWRIALSWISGYFIFQLFNPVVFASEGAKVAGQMGMTLAVLNGVSSIPMSWLNTKVPKLSTLIAQRSYEKLDQTFNQTVFQMSIVCLFCLLVFIVGLYTLSHLGYPVAERFLSLQLVSLLSSCVFVNQLVGAMATYLRCHKREPFLILSVVMGLLTAVSTILLGHLYGVNGIVVGYSFLTIIVSLIWAYSVFKKKKAEWHG